LDRLWQAAMIEAERALLGGSDLVETVVPLTSAALEEHAGCGLVVVFDDYHAVTAPASHRVLRALIDALPPDVRVVVSSRTVPPLRLGRRRVAQTVAEIGPQQLAFQGAESELLLNGSLALGLDPEQIATIDERVDGGAAGPRAPRRLAALRRHGGRPGRVPARVRALARRDRRAPDRGGLRGLVDADASVSLSYLDPRTPEPVALRGRPRSRGD
jgi:hypothetical protein